MPGADGLVVLWCAHGHDHLMAPDRAKALEAEPCCWCRWWWGLSVPIVRITLNRIASWDRPEVERLLRRADVDIAS